MAFVIVIFVASYIDSEEDDGNTNAIAARVPHNRVAPARGADSGPAHPALFQSSHFAVTNDGYERAVDDDAPPDYGTLYPMGGKTVNRQPGTLPMSDPFVEIHFGPHGARSVKFVRPSAHSLVETPPPTYAHAEAEIPY